MIFLTYQQYMTAQARTYVCDILAQTQGNMAAAARIAGVNRTHLFKIIRTLGLKAEDYRPLRYHLPENEARPFKVFLGAVEP
jgi:DNA-binding NtrC family response regulator